METIRDKTECFQSNDLVAQFRQLDAIREEMRTLAASIPEDELRSRLESPGSKMALYAALSQVNKLRSAFDAILSRRKIEPETPYWLKPYEHRERLSLGEAVCILAGADPEMEQPFDINDCESYANMRRWKHALIDAMNTERWHLDGTTWGMSQEEEQTISHAGIKAWARDTMAPWPFLDDTKVPAPESPEGRTIAMELKVAKDRIAELESDIGKARRRQKCTDDTARPFTSFLMPYVIEVHKQFWSTFDQSAPEAKPPKQSEIIEWLEKEKGLKAARAKAIEQVACPYDRDPSNK